MGFMDSGLPVGTEGIIFLFFFLGCYNSNYGFDSVGNLISILDVLMYFGQNTELIER